jgi:hypothetical protein
VRTRLLVALTPLVAVAASAVAPVVAQAEPHWYFNSKLLVKKKAVKTEAGITIGPIPGTTIVVSCKVKDVEILENPASGSAGVDLMRAFKFVSCGPNPCPVNSAGVQGKLKMTAGKLPWASKLVEVPPIADEIAGMEFIATCSKTGTLFVASGTLFPWVNPGFLEFNSPVTGTLGGVNVTGNDAFSPTTVEAKNP